MRERLGQTRSSSDIFGNSNTHSRTRISQQDPLKRKVLSSFLPSFLPSLLSFFRITIPSKTHQKNSTNISVSPSPLIQLNQVIKHSLLHFYILLNDFSTVLIDEDFLVSHNRRLADILSILDLLERSRLHMMALSRENEVRKRAVG